jgi:hypothetical protein
MSKLVQKLILSYLGKHNDSYESMTVDSHSRLAKMESEVRFDTDDKGISLWTLAGTPVDY